MASLTTVYIGTILIGSITAMAAAFLGTKIYPIQIGGDVATALAAPAAIGTAITAALKSATTSQEVPQKETEGIPELPEPSGEPALETEITGSEETELPAA